MNSICLSVAPNLRCQGLSKIENIILAVPSVVEVLFSLTLAFTNSSIRGKKRWLLVCDGLSFFLLAVADALAHLLPQVSSSNQAFTIFDFVLAGASFLPTLAYTLFLVLFSRANLITHIPTRFTRYIVVTLFILVPFIIVANELGSLLGLSHATFSLTNVTPVVGIQFLNVTFSRIAYFFSFVTVTLLTLFQAANFVLAFARVIRALVDARKAERDTTTQTSVQEVHLFRGLGWVCTGLKLGAIETVVGFTDINFGVAMTRRVLRLFSRATLIIGVIKGMNIVEDLGRWQTFKELSSQTSGGTVEQPMEQTQTRPMISNPRNSTFRQMSPSATEFHAAQRQRKIRKPGPSPLVLGTESAFNKFKNVENFPVSVASRKRPGERVTIRYDGESAPVLDVRFSMIGIDVPEIPKMPERAYLTTVIEDPHEDGSPAPGLRPVGMPQTAPVHPVSRMSTYGVPKPSSTLKNAGSFEVLREISAQFPSLPPRVMPGQRLPSDVGSRRDSDATWREVARVRSIQRRQQLDMGQSGNNAMLQGTTDISPVNSIKRKPVPSGNPAAPPSPAASTPSIYNSEEVEYERPRPAPTPPLSNPAIFSPTSSEEDALSRGSWEFTPGAPSTLTRASTFGTVDPTTPPTALVLSQPLLQRKVKQRPTSSQIISYTSSQLPPPRIETLPERRHRRLSQMRHQLGIMPTPQEDKPIETSDRGERAVRGWLRKQGPLYDLQAISRGDDAELDDAEAVIDDAWRRAGLTRIKSVSRVAVHTTPHAQRMSDVRSSLIAEEDDAEIFGLPSSLDPGRESAITASLRRPARSDSGVFGEEDRRLLRQSVYRR